MTASTTRATDVLQSCYSRVTDVVSRATIVLQSCLLVEFQRVTAGVTNGLSWVKSGLARLIRELSASCPLVITGTRINPRTGRA